MEGKMSPKGSFELAVFTAARQEAKMSYSVL